MSRDSNKRNQPCLTLTASKYVLANLTFKMSAQKRRSDAEGSGSSGSKRNLETQEALGIVPIHPCYKPYSIRNWIGKDKKTKKTIVHKNEEKPRELLDFLLNMGNANSFKVRTDKEAEEAVDMVFGRDHDWGDGLLSG